MAKYTLTIEDTDVAGDVTIAGNFDVTVDQKNVTTAQYLGMTMNVHLQRLMAPPPPDGSNVIQLPPTQ